LFLIRLRLADISAWNRVCKCRRRPSRTDGHVRREWNVYSFILERGYFKGTPDRPRSSPSATDDQFRGWLDELLRSSWDACQDSDLLIESPSAMGGVHIAEALRIPYFRAFTVCPTLHNARFNTDP
jgi:hypothetical protein